MAHHLAMQSQDYGGAKWAVGQRMARATDASIDTAFDAGEIVRTHVLRPTWHFVAPADLRWLQELTAPRVRAIAAPYLRKHGLDAAALKKSRRVIERELTGGERTRDELAKAFERAGLPTQGEAVSYQMIAAELDALVVSGARRGKQHSYALVDERIPPTPRRTREEALGELGRRYLESHGPALPQDFAWWSGLTIADAKRGFAAAAAGLETVDVDGQTYWLVPARRAAFTPPVVHLLPNYDEQLIAYRFRGNAVGGEVSARVGPGDGIFDGNLLLIDGQLVGGWRRELGKTHVEVTVRPLRKLQEVERVELEAAALRYARFLGLELRLKSPRP